MNSFFSKILFVLQLPDWPRTLSVFNTRKSIHYFTNYFATIREIHENLRGRRAWQIRSLMIGWSCLFAVDNFIKYWFNSDYPVDDREWVDPRLWLSMVTNDFARLYRCSPTSISLQWISLVPLHGALFYWLYWRGEEAECVQLTRRVLLAEPRWQKIILGTSRARFTEKGLAFLNRCQLSVMVFGFAYLIVGIISVTNYFLHYPPTSLENILGFLLLATFASNTMIFTLSLTHVCNLSAVLAYFMQQILTIRLNHNQRVHLDGPRTRPPLMVARNLLMFQRNHLKTMHHFFLCRPLLSNMLLLVLATNYLLSTTMVASTITRLATMMTLIVTPIVLMQSFCFITIHWIMARLSHQLHAPFKHFLLAVAKHGDRQRGIQGQRMGGRGGNRGLSPALQVHLKLSLFGQSFHTDNRYGLGYGPIGQVNMKSFTKSIYIYTKLLFRNLSNMV